MAGRGRKIGLACLQRDERFPSRNRHPRAGDRRLIETNCRIEKRCQGTGYKRYV
jgi:hypothetical protein